MNLIETKFLILNYTENVSFIIKRDHPDFYTQINSILDGDSFSEKLCIHTFYNGIRPICSCGANPTFINIMSGYYEKCKPCEMKRRTDNKELAEFTRQQEKHSRNIMSPSAVKEFLDKIQFNPSYKRTLRSEYPATYKHIESLNALDFKESLYLYYTNTVRKDYFCLNCSNTDVRFVNTVTGYKDFCSMSCNALYRNRNVK